jgi:energy-coupling factor transporter ATP-binding protein EcfA2
VNYTSYSVTNSSTQDNCYPTVKVFFYCRDYWADWLLQQKKNANSCTESQYDYQNQKNVLINTLNKTNLLIQELEKLKSVCSENKNKESNIKDSIKTCNKKLNECKVEQEQVFTNINKPENNIINLNDFIKCTDKYKISVFESEPEVIIKYRKESSDIKNIKSFDSNSLLGKTISCIQKTALTSEKANGKDIIALIGNTGAGKSTLINYLWGLKMIKNKGFIEVENSNEEIAKIGHSKGSSETLITQIYQKTNSYTFVDCGGFLDTRGDDVDVEVVSSLKFTLEGAKSVKLGVCCDCSLLGIDRGVGFTAFIKQALKGLIINYQDHQGSILLMFTKPKNIDGDLYNKEDAINELKEIQKDLIDNDEKDLYQFLLRDEGKYICVCNPLADPTEELSIFDKMSGIYNPSKAFNVPYSNSVLLTLRDTMIKTADAANELFRKYKLAQKNYDTEILNCKDFTEQEKKINVIINQNSVAIKQQEDLIGKNKIIEIQNQINKMDVLINSSYQTSQNYLSQFNQWNTTNLVAIQIINNQQSYVG